MRKNKSLGEGRNLLFFLSRKLPYKSEAGDMLSGRCEICCLQQTASSSDHRRNIRATEVNRSQNVLPVKRTNIVKIKYVKGISTTGHENTVRFEGRYLGQVSNRALKNRNKKFEGMGLVTGS
jgi:hypothetical protein